MAVLGAAPLHSVASGRLGRNGTLTTPVAQGSYEVCLQPPPGWVPVTRTPPAPPGWVCMTKHVGTRGATVTFTLVHPVAGQ